MKRIVLAVILFAALAGSAQAAAPRLLGIWTESDGPYDIVATPSGDVWVAYSDVPRIVRYNTKGVQQTTITPAGRPLGIAVDASGNLYEADTNGNTVTEYSRTGSLMTSWGNDTVMNGPIGIAVDASGNVLVADAGNNQIEVFSASGSELPPFGVGIIAHPNDVAVDGSGNVYVTDQDSNQVVKFSAGTKVASWGSFGSGVGQFDLPSYVSADSSGHVFVTDENNGRIQEFSSGGTFVNQWGTGGDTPGTFTNPLGIAADVAGNVYVADQGNSRIQKFYTGPSPCSAVNRTHRGACGEEQTLCLGQLVPTVEVSCMTKLAKKYARFRSH